MESEEEEGEGEERTSVSVSGSGNGLAAARSQGGSLGSIPGSGSGKEGGGVLTASSRERESRRASERGWRGTAGKEEVRYGVRYTRAAVMGFDGRSIYRRR